MKPSGPYNDYVQKIKINTVNNLYKGDQEWKSKLHHDIAQRSRSAVGQAIRDYCVQNLFDNSDFLVLIAPHHVRELAMLEDIIRWKDA